MMNRIRLWIHPGEFSNFITRFIGRHEILCLFTFIYVIYNLNGRPIGSGDTIPASLLPFSILENHNLYLDQFSSYFRMMDQPWMILERRNHILSLYPIVTPILITPFYFLPYVLLKLVNYPIDISNSGFALIVSILEKSSASAIATCSAIFVFMSLKELLNRRIAFISTVIFAFATSTWSTSSQGLWQHGLVELLLALSIYLVIRNEKKESTKNIIYLGIIYGFFIFNRPADGVLLLPIFFYVFMFYNKKLVYFLSFIIISSAPFTLYNIYYFNNLFGGYGNLMPAFGLNYYLISNSLGLLISPSRGLFIYTPIAVLSIFGYLKVKDIVNNRLKYVLLFYGPAIIIQIYIYSSFGNWWGGGSYGPRFLTGMLPIVSIYIGLYLSNFGNLNKIDKIKLFHILIIILLSCSLFVQVVGTFYFPNGNWNEAPKNVDFYPERLWDWNDPQIIRTFEAGPIIVNSIKILYSSYKLKNDIIILNDKNSPITKISLDKNWYKTENLAGTPTRWMENDAIVFVNSEENCLANLSLQALSFYQPRTLEVYAGEKLVASAGVPTSLISMNEPIYLAKGPNTMRFHVPEGCTRPCDIKELNNPDDRCLGLAVQNLTMI
jgi:hypothetical protein